MLLALSSSARKFRIGNAGVLHGESAWRPGCVEFRCPRDLPHGHADPLRSDDHPGKRRRRPGARHRARAAARASTSTTPCSASARARPSATSRPATGSPSSTWRATASTSTTAACQETAEQHRARLRLRRARRRRRRRAVGAGQAPLHRPPDRPQAAGVRRDVLQLGLGQDAAPRLLPQPLHLRAARDLDRAHRRRPAVVPQLLPAAAGPAPRADRHRARLPVRAPVRAISAPICATCSRPSARRFPRPFRLEANHQIQVLSSPFFRNQTAYIVGRVVNGIHTYPFVVPIKHDAAGQALRRRAADGRSRPRDPVLGEPRVFPRRHGSAVGLRRLPARDPAGQDGGRALHDGRAAEGGQEPLLPRLPAPPQALARQVHHRPGHQGPRDDGVHAAVLPVRVQGDPRQDRRVEGHRPAEGQGEVLARQAPRPRRADDRHPRVLRRRVSARALLRRAHRRAQRGGAFGASSSTATTSSSSTSTSSGG